MSKNKGTPKTLEEAIENGLNQATTVLMGPVEAQYLAKELRPHIKDWLAQSFGVLSMSKVPIVAEVSMEQWMKMFPEDRKVLTCPYCMKPAGNKTACCGETSAHFVMMKEG